MESSLRSIEKRVKQHLRSLKGKKVALLKTNNPGFFLVKDLLIFDYEEVDNYSEEFDVFIIALEIEELTKQFFSKIFSGKIESLNSACLYPLIGVTRQESIFYCTEKKINFVDNFKLNLLLDEISKLNPRLFYSIGSTIKNLSDVLNR